MAIETTPLGFQKPDGNDPVRNGDNVIAANGAKAEELHQEARGRLGLIEAKNAAQDTDIANARTNAVADAKTYTDGAVNADRARLTSVESKSAAQDGRLTGLESKTPAEAISNEVFFGITDEAGRRTWLETGFDGKPTARAADLLYSPLGLTPGADPVDDIMFSVTDDTGRRTDLEVRADGHFPQRVVDNIGGRLSPDGFPQSFKDALAAQVAGMVNSGTVDAADTGYDVILLAGQSNMSGRGTPYDQRTDPPHGEIWQWGSSGAYVGVMSQAVEPLAMVDTPSGIGPGLVFARFYQGITAPNRQTLLVPAAQGGQALVGGTWDPNTPGANAQNAIARANAAIASHPKARLKAILWVQGETDGDNGATGPAYQTKLDALFARFRAEITGAANVPIVVGGMVPEYLSTGTRTAINAVHLDTPHRLAYTAFAAGITSANLGDGNHYNAIGARKLGRAMFDAYLLARTRTTTI